jgi:hypothetical protein
MGRKVSPAGRKSSEGVLVIVDGWLLVVNGSEEVADEVRGFTARLMAWSASSDASYGEGEMRPEVL